MKFATVTLMNEDGEYFWEGSFRKFARDNGLSRDEVREIVETARTMHEGLYEPVMRGGGASPVVALLF